MDSSESVPNQSRQQQQWIVMKDPPEIIKDGISELSKDNPLAYEHIEKMSSVLPTMWMGAQNGRYSLFILQCKFCCDFLSFQLLIIFKQGKCNYVGYMYQLKVMLY